MLRQIYLCDIFTRGIVHDGDAADPASPHPVRTSVPLPEGATTGGPMGTDHEHERKTP